MNMWDENSLELDKSPILVEEAKGADILMIIFGGIAQGLPVPVFEFMNFLSEYRVHKIFLRDFAQSWYTKGLPGFSKNIDDTAQFIGTYLSKYSRCKKIFLGNSAGGYAALVFGLLTNADSVHAFVPQTFLTPALRIYHRDLRWRKQIKRLNRSKGNRKYMNLTHLFHKEKKFLKQTKFHLYWNVNDRLDNIHSKRLKGNEIVHHKYNFGGHNLIKTLRDNGELELIIRKILSH